MSLDNTSSCYISASGLVYGRSRSDRHSPRRSSHIHNIPPIRRPTHPSHPKTHPYSYHKIRNHPFLGQHQLINVTTLQTTVTTTPFLIQFEMAARFQVLAAISNPTFSFVVVKDEGVPASLIYLQEVFKTQICAALGHTHAIGVCPKIPWGKFCSSDIMTGVALDEEADEVLMALTTYIDNDYHLSLKYLGCINNNSLCAVQVTLTLTPPTLTVATLPTTLPTPHTATVSLNRCQYKPSEPSEQAPLLTRPALLLSLCPMGGTFPTGTSTPTPTTPADAVPSLPPHHFLTRPTSLLTMGLVAGVGAVALYLGWRFYKK